MEVLYANNSNTSSNIAASTTSGVLGNSNRINSNINNNNNSKKTATTRFLRATKNNDLSSTATSSSDTALFFVNSTQTNNNVAIANAKSVHFIERISSTSTTPTEMMTTAVAGANTSPATTANANKKIGGKGSSSQNNLVASSFPKLPKLIKRALKNSTGSKTKLVSSNDIVSDFIGSSSSNVNVTSNNNNNNKKTGESQSNLIDLGNGNGSGNGNNSNKKKKKSKNRNKAGDGGKKKKKAAKSSSNALIESLQKLDFTSQDQSNNLNDNEPVTTTITLPSLTSEKSSLYRSPDSVRWGDGVELADERAERARIDAYKQNRRRRYIQQRARMYSCVRFDLYDQEEEEEDDEDDDDDDDDNEEDEDKTTNNKLNEIFRTTTTPTTKTNINNANIIDENIYLFSNNKMTSSPKARNNDSAISSLSSNSPFI